MSRLNADPDNSSLVRHCADDPEIYRNVAGAIRAFREAGNELMVKHLERHLALADEVIAARAKRDAKGRAH